MEQSSCGTEGLARLWPRPSTIPPVPETSTHPDVAAEQAHLDHAYECLEDMRRQAAHGLRITVLTPRQAKGLEFDHVMVAEPSAIVAEARDGYRQLYVALTRSTQTLKVFHERELPPELTPVSA